MVKKRRNDGVKKDVLWKKDEPRKRYLYKKPAQRSLSSQSINSLFHQR
jgi:hypothetical protein